MQNPDPHPYYELGRRLYAALLSQLLHISSVDYTLRTYVPEEIELFWMELARSLLQRAEGGIEVNVLPDQADPLREHKQPW